MRKEIIECDICGKKTGPRVTCYDLLSSRFPNRVLVRAIPYLRAQHIASGCEADLCTECYIEALQGIIRSQDIYQR